MSLQLEEIERIKRVKYLYCQAIDTRDLALLETVLTEDFACDNKGGWYHMQVSGRSEFIETIRQATHPDYVGNHIVQHPLIDVAENGETAAGTWRLTDYSLNTADNNRTTLGAATISEEYRKVDGQWRIARSGYRRIYERMFHDPEPALSFSIIANGGPA